MISTVRVASLIFLVFGYASQQAMAVEENVESCEDLITLANDASDESTFTMTAAFPCSSTVTIADGQIVTVDGGDTTINIGTGFTGDSVFSVEAGGQLTLRGVNFVENNADQDETGVRAVKSEGIVIIESCTFTELNGRDFASMLPEGGAVYASAGEVTIDSSLFKSNVASSAGGAVYVGDGVTLTVSDTSFSSDEAVQAGDDEGSQGGDIYAADDATLRVSTSNFTGSSIGYAGAAIKCCGASITNCVFSGTESSAAEANFGAVVSGLPGGETCKSLRIEDSVFSGCAAARPNGEGGAIAIFNTPAEISRTVITGSTGTGVVFYSSSPEEEHLLQMSSVQFNKNQEAAYEFHADDNQEQGTAFAIKNTAVEDGSVPMGFFENVYCFANDPYECEFVYDFAEVEHNEEFKCQICNLEGERQFVTTDDDAVSETDRSADSGDSDSGTQALVIGLSVALGATLFALAGLAAYKIRQRNTARRLMEDMRDQDL